MSITLHQGYITLADAKALFDKMLSDRIAEALDETIYAFPQDDDECLVCAYENAEFTCLPDELVEADLTTTIRVVPQQESFWYTGNVHDLISGLFLVRSVAGTDVLKVDARTLDGELVSGAPVSFELLEFELKRKADSVWSNFANHEQVSRMVKVCPAHDTRCAVCETSYVTPNTRGHWYYSDSLCSECAQCNVYCEGGNHFTPENTYSWRSDAWCFDCLREEGLDLCSNCGDVYDDDYGCTECYDDYSGHRAIHSYNYKPDPRFGFHPEIDGDLSTARSRVGKVFMGLEIEVEAMRASIGAGIDILKGKLDAFENYFYLKQDGSINNGFEIVTHPATLAGHKMQNLDAFKELAELGFRGWRTDTCGIHVHVNRDAFNGVPHQWRWTRMFAHNQREFVILAGRESGQWASFNEMKDKLSWAFKHHHGRGENRYEAINLCNWNTFEVRIFKSSLNTARIQMIIELIDATVEYTRHLTIREMADHALEWSRFASWVRSEQAEKYPNLIAYCDKHSI